MFKRVFILLACVSMLALAEMNTQSYFVQTPQATVSVTLSSNQPGFQNIFLRRFGFTSLPQSRSNPQAESEKDSRQSRPYSSLEVIRQMFAQARALADQRFAALQESLQKQRLSQENEAEKGESDFSDESAGGRSSCAEDVTRLCPTANSFVERSDCVYRMQTQLSAECLSWLEDKPLGCVPDLVSLCSESVSSRQAMLCLRENYVDLSSRCRASLARAQFIGFRNRFLRFRERIGKFFESNLAAEHESDQRRVHFETASNGPSEDFATSSIPILSEIQSNPPVMASASAPSPATFRTSQTAGSSESHSFDSRTRYFFISACLVAALCVTLMLQQGRAQVKPVTDAPVSPAECAPDSPDSDESLEAPLIVLPSAPQPCTVTGPVRP